MRKVKKRLTGPEEACSTMLKRRTAFHLTIPVFTRAFPASRRRRVISALMIPILGSIVSPPCLGDQHQRQYSRASCERGLRR